MPENHYERINHNNNVLKDEMEPLSPETALKTPDMPSPDRMFPGGHAGSANSESGYTVVQLDNRLHSNGVSSNALYPVSSNTQLIPNPADRVRPSHLPVTGCKNIRTNSDEFLDSRSRHSSGLYFNKRKGYCSMKFTDLFFVIAMVISFVLIGYLFYTVLKLQARCEALETRLNSKPTPAPVSQEEPKMCLPCEELSLGPFDEDTPGLNDLYKMEEKGKRVCCAKDTAQLSILLNLFAKRKNLEKCAQELFNEGSNKSSSCNQTGTVAIPPARPASTSSVSAHLLAGKQPRIGGDVESFNPIRNWQTDLPGSHLTGIRLHDDRLIVPESGVYFLYSQVGFMVYYDHQNDVDKSGAQSLFHTVFRYNVMYPKEHELLRSSVTECWEEQKDYGRYTSYVGGAVKLNQGDAIYVKVSKIQFLADNEPETTYFGLFKLS